MKIAIVLGTRPEIIKMAPIVRACEQKKIPFFILHTGQHYDRVLDTQIFEELELPKPAYNLKVGGQPYRMQVGLMTKHIMRILKKEKPSVVIVQGDTISVLAGALAANKLGIPLAHHEAGLRSHDITMLEEINRTVVDHIADYLFAPTVDAKKNLIEEGRRGIYLTGNTIVDAVMQNTLLAQKKSSVLQTQNLETKNYVLATVHRAETTDKKERLESVMRSLSAVAKEFNKPLLLVLHPRTKKKMNEFGVAMPEGVLITAPVGFLDFLMLEKNASLILTDSGGAQEEAFILGIPCVTLRDNTERPETVARGANIVAGVETESVRMACKKMLQLNIIPNVGHPFGNGKTALKIIATLARIKKH